MTTLNSVIVLQGNKASFVKSHTSTTAGAIINSPELTELTAAGKSALMSAATFGGSIELSLEDTVQLAVLLDRNTLLTAPVVPAAVVAPTAAGATIEIVNRFPALVALLAAVPKDLDLTKLDWSAAIAALQSKDIPQILSWLQINLLADPAAVVAAAAELTQLTQQLKGQLKEQLKDIKVWVELNLQTYLTSFMTEIMKEVLTTPIAAKAA